MSCFYYYYYLFSHVRPPCGRQRTQKRRLNLPRRNVGSYCNTERQDRTMEDDIYRYRYIIYKRVAIIIYIYYIIILFLFLLLYNYSTRTLPTPERMLYLTPAFPVHSTAFLPVVSNFHFSSCQDEVAPDGLDLPSEQVLH